MVRGLVIILFLFLIDLYVFQAVRMVSRNLAPSTQRFIEYAFWIFFASVGAVVVLTWFTDFYAWNNVVRTYLIAVIIGVYISKVVVVLFLLIDDFFRLCRWVYSWVGIWLSSAPIGEAAEQVAISRQGFLSRLGLVMAAVPFFTLLYGMMGNVYRFKVRQVRIPFPNLPAGFDGVRIAQFSDFHIGSFLDTEKVKVAVDMIMAQKADMILFTGDLVNDHASETETYLKELASLKAPLGVFSVLGNHDYGDYVQWDTPEQKVQNLNRLKEVQHLSGWDLLNNEHRVIARNGDTINLVGIENWSNFGRFPKYGDMQKATAGMPDSSFNLLMSHDPSHWRAQVLPTYKKIDLMLSGHTHGMQFGIDIPSWRWSPVKYFYPEWADLYAEGAQKLYVNRGLGFIGYPGRVGILPEITVFTLVKA